MSEVNDQVKELAKEIGDSLINRVKKYLKDDVDTGFMKELALDMAKLQYKALTAKTDAEKELVEDDIAFTRGRIDTFIARNALKVKNEAKDIFEDILKAVSEAVVIIAKTALKSIIPI